MNSEDFYINNCIIITKLRQKGFAMSYGKVLRSVAFHKGGKAVNLRYKLWCIDREPEPLDYMDLLVMDAVYYFFNNWKKYPKSRFTVRQLAGLLAGENVSVSPARIQRLIHSVEKLAATMISIDYSEEMEAAKPEGYSEDTDYVIEAPLLPVVPAGKRGEYIIQEIPPLYEYARLKKHIITVPRGLFSCSTPDIRSTDAVLLTKYYLIRQMEILRNANSREGSSPDYGYSKKQISFISRDDNGCLMQQIDWNEDGGNIAAGRIMSRREILRDISEPYMIHKVRSIQRIADEFLKYCMQKGYICGDGVNPAYSFIHYGKDCTRGAVLDIQLGNINDLRSIDWD